MFEEVFGTSPGSYSEERWRWWYERAPAGPGLGHVLESSGELVGHLGHVGFNVFVEGRRLRVGHGGDTMVRIGHRGPSGLPRLLEGFLASNHGFDLRMNFPGDGAALAIEMLGGGRRLGRIPRWEHRRVRARRRISLRPRSTLRVEQLEELGDEIDTLASASAAFAPCIRVRDAAYLRWRWLEQPGAAWTLRAARDRRGRLLGLSVLGYEEHLEERRGLIADLLSRDSAATEALLTDASEALIGEDCKLVVCDYLDPRPWVGQGFGRAGFRSTGGAFNIVCGSLSIRGGPLPERRESWYLTRGDTAHA